MSNCLFEATLQHVERTPSRDTNRVRASRRSAWTPTWPTWGSRGTSWTGERSRWKARPF